jgi:hypothetical protein
MKLLISFMGSFNLHIGSQSNLCHIIWTWKSTPKVTPKISSFFRGWEWFLVMKTNSINQKNYIGMFTTSILNCMKKNQIFVKTFHLLESTWISFFKLPQILGPIQVLVSNVKKNDYNN